MKKVVEQQPDSPVSYRAPAAEKALDILESLACQTKGISLASLSRELGRSVGELYRVVTILERRGYILRDRESDHYLLSPRLFELSHVHPPSAKLLTFARPIMESLSRQITQSCHLAVANGTKILILASEDSPLPMRYSVKTGASFQLLETSSGIVILAFSNQDLVEKQFSGMSARDRRSFMERMEAVRDSGYEMRESAVVGGVINISTPVFDHFGTAKAALTIPYLTQTSAEVSADDARERLRHAANELSGKFGYSGSAS